MVATGRLVDLELAQREATAATAAVQVGGVQRRDGLVVGAGVCSQVERYRGVASGFCRGGESNRKVNSRIPFKHYCSLAIGHLIP